MNEREQAAQVTRDQLYALVWAEPMVKVADKFGVSSSYMARICALMRVPRPERGYWAKHAVGKAAPKPELPEAHPGDQLFWNRGSSPEPIRRPLPRPPTVKPRRSRKAVELQRDLHPLIRGASTHFEAAALRTTRSTSNQLNVCWWIWLFQKPVSTKH
jgi:hypothetical protein